MRAPVPVTPEPVVPVWPMPPVSAEEPAPPKGLLVELHRMDLQHARFCQQYCWPLPTSLLSIELTRRDPGTSHPESWPHDPLQIYCSPFNLLEAMLVILPHSLDMPHIICKDTHKMNLQERANRDWPCTDSFNRGRQDLHLPPLEPAPRRSRLSMTIQPKTTLAKKSRTP